MRLGCWMARLPEGLTTGLPEAWNREPLRGLVVGAFAAVMGREALFREAGLAWSNAPVILALGIASWTALARVIRAKTAALFAAASEMGPILAGRPKAEIAACRGYGANLGIAFQLIDDALDYGGSSAKLGKNVGDDFREGKITLPVVLAYRRGSDEDRAFWKRCLQDGGATDGDLDHAIALLKETKAIETTVDRARHYGAMAKDALAPFKDGPHKRALLEVVDFCVSRVH